MRKGQKPYMLQMQTIEKDFIEEMAWRNKMPKAQYIRALIREQMEKHPEVVHAISNRADK